MKPQHKEVTDIEALVDWCRRRAPEEGERRRSSFDSRLADIMRASERNPHGKRARYAAGCHCMLCRAANSRYETERARERVRGNSNGLVDAERARKHLAWLSKRGVGRRSVAAASDISVTILWWIITGERTRIRKHTEEAILAVDEGACSGGCLVSAGPAQKIIRELVGRGYTKAALAQRMGLKTPAIQFMRAQSITARTAAAVQRLYDSIEIGVMKPGRIR